VHDEWTRSVGGTGLQAPSAGGARVFRCWSASAARRGREAELATRSHAWMQVSANSVEAKEVVF
jgi:hypothetical protein